MSKKQYYHRETVPEICISLVLKHCDEEFIDELDPDGTGKALLQSLEESVKAKGQDSPIYEIHGDETGTISIGGKAWAAEDPSPLRGCSKTLPSSVWERCYLAAHRFYRDSNFGDLDKFLSE